MKPKLISIHFCLAVAAGLAASPISSRAQDVLVTGSLTDTSLGGGIFKYTLTLHNTGTEAVESLWFGWTVGNFNVANPSSPGNLLAWTSTLDGSSIQYGGTSGTALAPNASGTFTFDSTAAPSQIPAMNGWDSVAYGVDASQFAIENTTLHSDEFTPSVVTTPEPSTFSLFAIGTLGLANIIRRKIGG
jgi:hypothetical protein